MATSSSGSRSQSGSSRERTRASGKKANKSLTKKAAASKEVTSSSPHNEVTEGEEEYEVEAIRAHQWSNEHQEYEYLLKWKGYGEEENSWVPASLMNCWDLLQCYLSKNIFNNPSATSLSSNTSLVSSTSSKKKGHTKTKTPKRRNGALRNIQVVHSRRKSSNASFSEPTVKKKVTAGQPQVEKVKKCNQFSPRSPLSIKLGGGRVRKQGLSSSQRRAKLQQLLQPKSGGAGKMRSPGHSAILLPPSIASSPILSSCDDMSSSQSDCSVSVDDTFRLYLDSDEESNTSVENPLAGGMSHSPKLQALTHSSQQSHVNGYRLQHINNVKSRLPSGHSRKGKILVKKNGLSRRNLPSSTTHNDSTDDSTESWSKNRLRKRVRSSSPSPSLESAILDCSSGGHAEVSSTTSPPPNPPPPPPAITTGPLVPVRQSPSPEYQQELLEWQFMLNKQCRPAEAFILVENRIDEASIPWGFKYITSNIYGEGVPDPGRSEIVSRICGCTCYIMGKRCGPKNEHCCPQMAGAEFPYSPAGKVKLPAGNPIYECNSRCSCPQDCTNRVVQRGRKINMSIFRTSNGRGWGVKTMEPIKPNTFVTEYVGEVVTTEEAERRGQLYDQEGRTYLFDLDFDCDDNAFTIDAAHYGNISHFFNHSCNPNLRVYSVWIDTLDERLPRIAFFSTQNISAGQELTFDYQMNQEEEGQVLCLCGQPNCCGYLY